LKPSIFRRDRQALALAEHMRQQGLTFTEGGSDENWMTSDLDGS